MARPKKLTPADEARIVQRLQAGEGVRTIGADFGVSHMLVQRLSMRVRRSTPTEAQAPTTTPTQPATGAPPTSAPADVDVLERIMAQRQEAIDLLRTVLPTQEKGSDIAAVVNSLRGLWAEQERAAQLARGSGTDDETTRSTASVVRAKFEAMRRAGTHLAAVPAATAEPVALDEAADG